jgi:hypothetical protein
VAVHDCSVHAAGELRSQPPGRNTLEVLTGAETATFGREVPGSRVPAGR